MITIKRASVIDKSIITNLARDIYKEHYLHLWNPGGARWYMEEYAYAEAIIEKELQDGNVMYFIADDDGVNMGYLKIVLTSILKDFEGCDALEIERIYLYKAHMGKGIGKQLMDVAKQKALELHKNVVFIKAMDSSIEVIEFYKRMGYSICGKTELPLPLFELMKKEYRGMVILKRDLMKQKC